MNTCRVLRRLGLNRMRNMEPVAPARRYERVHSGEPKRLDPRRTSCGSATNSNELHKRGMSFRARQSSATRQPRA